MRQWIEFEAEYEQQAIPVYHETVQAIPQQSWCCDEWIDWLGLSRPELLRHGFKPIDWKILDGILYFRNHDGRVAYTVGLTIKGQNTDGYFGHKSDELVELEWLKS